MPKTEAKIKGHIAHIKNNSRSTTTNKNSGGEQTHIYPIQEQHNGKTDVFMATVDKTHKIYTDQLVKFPMTSSRGNIYVLIRYLYDANAILEEQLKSRYESHILEA